MKEERKKRTLQLALWTWMWVATLALATFGPKFIWDNHATFTIFAIGVNLINGVLMILANLKLFNHYDELERRIHAEAMGFTLGAAIVVGLSYSLLDISNIITQDAEISLLIGFIGLTYMISLVVNKKRYL